MMCHGNQRDEHEADEEEGMDLRIPDLDVDEGRATEEGGGLDVEAVAFLEKCRESATTSEEAMAEIEKLLNDSRRRRRLSRSARPAVADGEEAVDEGPIIKILRVIIIKAIQEGASEAHIEPELRGVLVRFRVDGVLREEMKLPKYVLASLISRVKTAAMMNIAELRVPQTGQIHVRIGGQDYSFKAYTMPTALGERVVLRVVRRAPLLHDLNVLGMSDAVKAGLLELARGPQGLVLVCGPPDSGKTSTMYSLLKAVRSKEILIATIEDPVVGLLRDVRQTSVRRDRNGALILDYSTAIRAFQDQGAGVIAVDLISDRETAEAALKAARRSVVIAGSLAPDATSAVGELLAYGLDPSLVALGLSAILTQRLVRKICNECCEKGDNPSSDLLRGLGFEPEAPLNATIPPPFYHGTGKNGDGACLDCRGTGFKGRTGIFELTVLDSAVREAILKGDPPTLQDALAKACPQKLKEAALEAVLVGTTQAAEAAEALV